MPGTPGPRLTGGDTHASDRVRVGRGDTPCDVAGNLPMNPPGLSVVTPTLQLPTAASGGSHE